jgi:hypothetical protein
VNAADDAIKNDRRSGALCGAFDLDPLRIWAGQDRVLGRGAAAIQASEETN